jgi:hypothetical protein
MGLIYIDEYNVLAGTQKVSADYTANRAGAPN